MVLLLAVPAAPNLKGYCRLFIPLTRWLLVHIYEPQPLPGAFRQCFNTGIRVPLHRFYRRMNPGFWAWLNGTAT